MKLKILHGLVLLCLVAVGFSGGCATTMFNSQGQPYMTAPRLERGLVIVLTGIEGRSRWNEGIANGLFRGGVRYAIEIEDWTSSASAIVNLEAQETNRRTAAAIAQRVMRYRWTYPDRPVYLVGQSGGGAMAAWIAESMQGERLDGIVMLAATLSPGYRLDRALSKTDRGIVSFHSDRDMFMLGLGTHLLRTMDGEFTSSAGKVGFQVPTPKPSTYDKLHQIGWNSRMADTGNNGMHLTSGSTDFVAAYVAPLIMTDRWDSPLMKGLAAGKPPRIQLPPEETAQRDEDDLRQRVR